MTKCVSRIFMFYQMALFKKSVTLRKFGIRVIGEYAILHSMFLLSIWFHEIRLGGFRKVAMAIFWSNFIFQNFFKIISLLMPDGRVKNYTLCDSLRLLHKNLTSKLPLSHSTYDISKSPTNQTLIRVKR